MSTSRSNTDATNKLVSCLELAFRESAGARKALREWLDELDMAEHAKTPSPTRGPVFPFQKEEPQPPACVQMEEPVETYMTYFGVRAYHDLDPEDYKWSPAGGNERSRVAYCERELPSLGLIRMNYYYTTGLVQLTYNNPYCSQSSDDEDYFNGRRITMPRRIQETFNGLTTGDFLKLLKNPPTFYGKGYR